MAPRFASSGEPFFRARIEEPMTNLATIPVVMAVLVGACFQPVDVQNAPCPCGEGWECCAATQTCAPTGQCDAATDAGESGTGGGGGQSQNVVSLEALPIVTDGVAPVGVVVPGLATPAQLALVGDTAFVLARRTSQCERENGAWVPAVSRFEFVAGAWTLSWSKTLPVSGERFVMIATADGVTVAGQGQVDGEAARGGTEAVVVRVSTDGTLAWTRRFATLFDDSADALLARTGGKVIVAGTTGGGVGGNASQGSDDVWVAQLAADGAVDWVQQLGTSLDENSPGLLAVDDDAFIVSGRTGGALVGGSPVPVFPESALFIRKYDAMGTTVWTRQHAVASTTLVRWGDGFATADGDRWSAVTRLDADGELEWRRDFTPLTQPALGELHPLDVDRLALHGVHTKSIFGPGVYPARELAEQIFTADGGLSITPGIGGGWPRQIGGVYEVALAHRNEGTWFLAGSVNGDSKPGDILSLSGFTPTGATRVMHFDWQFTGAGYRTSFTPSEALYGIMAVPSDLGFSPSGAVITVGRTLWNGCADQAGWLFLTRVQP